MLPRTRPASAKRPPVPGRRNRRARSGCTRIAAGETDQSTRRPRRCRRRRRDSRSNEPAGGRQRFQTSAMCSPPDDQASGRKADNVGRRGPSRCAVAPKITTPLRPATAWRRIPGRDSDMSRRKKSPGQARQGPGAAHSLISGRGHGGRAEQETDQTLARRGSARARGRTSSREVHNVRASRGVDGRRGF